MNAERRSPRGTSWTAVSSFAETLQRYRDREDISGWPAMYGVTLSIDHFGRRSLPCQARSLT
jgi:hypothetical protein